MKIASPAFGNNQPIPKKYTCDGGNINPPLAFSDIPPKTKSLVLIVDDPDAPMGTWVHWNAWNISPQIKEIGENSSPAGAIEGITSFGRTGYGGPCPPASPQGGPSGTHRYFFKLFALNIGLDLPPSTTKKDLGEKIEKHLLAQAELIGFYSRDS